MIRAILPLFKWALENPDKDGDNVLRAIQACESTVWMKLRPGESLISCIINTVLDKMDLDDPEKQFAHNIDIDVEEELKPWTKGLSIELREKMTKDLLDFGLIRTYLPIKEGEIVGKHVTKLRLTPLWDRLLRSMKERGLAHSVYTESLGKMLACASIEQGVQAIIPIVRIINVAKSNNGKIKNDDMLDICMAYGRQYRMYTDMIAHDSNKPEEIRLFIHHGKRDRTINPIVFRMMELWIELARELWRELEEEKGG